MAYPKKTESRTGEYTIYLHTMKSTGKRYVGCTGQEPARRFQNGFGYEKNELFFGDIKKYGWEDVQTDILARVKDFELACCFEAAAIQRYKATQSEHGYNLWTSGEPNTPVASVGNKISERKMGHPVSAQTRRKLMLVGREPVLCLDFQGNVVSEYSSLTDAAKAVGAFKTNIWAVCEGRRKSCRGFVWTRKRDRWNTAKRAEEADRVKHGLGDDT